MSTSLFFTIKMRGIRRRSRSSEDQSGTITSSMGYTVRLRIPTQGGAVVSNRFQTFGFVVENPVSHRTPLEPQATSLRIAGQSSGSHIASNVAKYPGK